MTDCGVVLITASTRKEAETIARILVEKKLAACANIFPEIFSLYWWKGKICEDKEIFLTAKTTSRLFSALCREVKAIHSYDVPEIVFLPIQDGSEEYLNWISEVTG